MIDVTENPVSLEKFVIYSIVLYIKYTHVFKHINMTYISSSFVLDLLRISIINIIFNAYNIISFIWTDITFLTLRFVLFIRYVKLSIKKKTLEKRYGMLHEI